MVTLVAKYITYICTSRQNEKMEFHFFVCSFCRVVQFAQTKKWNFISSFVRFVALVKTPKRKNAKTKYQNFISSFVRFVALYKSPKRRNGFHFIVCSSCRLPHSTMEWKNDKVTAKYQSLICGGFLFVLSFVRFVDFQKTPKRQNDNATKWGFAAISFCRLFVLWRYTSRENEEMKELVARPMYRSLYHFIVLILIKHVLWYDTRQENNYFITTEIDKKTKIK